MRRPPPRRAGRPEPSALSSAVRMLARREYGRAELRARLLMRGVAEADADAALDELARRGLLSDARYAEAIVAQKAGRYGRRAIAHALKEKGVDEAAAASAPAAPGLIGPGTGTPTAARILASISAAVSGCSRRYSRALSLP